MTSSGLSFEILESSSRATDDIIQLFSQVELYFHNQLTDLYV